MDQYCESSESSANGIAPAVGKLGVMMPGMGAVATTFVAGVEAVRRGLAQPIGSVTQMGTIRLGKRTEGRSPKIKDFVPLAGLDDLVFTGWDIFPDDMYAAACKAGVLDRELVEAIKPFLQSITPRPAVFDRRYVRRLDGPHVKAGKTKMDLAVQVREDIRTVDVVARTSGPNRLDPTKLLNMTLSSSDGRLIPLSQIGNVIFQEEDAILKRRDRVPTITVESDMDESLQPPPNRRLEAGP